MEGLLLFALVGVGFLAVAVRPEWCAPYFAFVIFLRASDTLRGEFGLPSLFMVIAPGLLMLVAGRWLLFGEPAGRNWRPALWMLLLYGSVCALSLLFAIDGERTREALLDYLDGIFVVLIMTASLRSARDFQRTEWALIGAGLILAGLAVFQQLTGSFDSTFAGFSQVDPRGVDPAKGFRSEGPLSANYFALVLVAVVPLAVDRWLHDAHRGARWLAAGAVFVTLVAIVFTYSRGGLVALAAVCVAMFGWVPRHRRGRVLLAGALGIALTAPFLLPGEYVKRLATFDQLLGAAQGATPQDNALRGRLSEVTSAAMMFADHPFVGVGHGNFEVHYPRYARVLALDGRREERQAHSLYLEVAAETGAIGVIVFGGLLVFAGVGVRRTRSLLESRGDDEIAHVVTAFGISMLGYLAGSLFLHLTFPRYFWLLFGIALATRQLTEVAEPLPSRVVPTEARRAEVGA